MRSSALSGDGGGKCRRQEESGEEEERFDEHEGVCAVGVFYGLNVSAGLTFPREYILAVYIARGRLQSTVKRE